METWVASQLEENELLWVPVRTAYAIQNNSAFQKAEAEAEAERLAEIEAESGPKKVRF